MQLLAQLTIGRTGLTAGFVVWVLCLVGILPWSQITMLQPSGSALLGRPRGHGADAVERRDAAKQNSTFRVSWAWVLAWS